MERSTGPAPQGRVPLQGNSLGPGVSENLEFCLLADDLHAGRQALKMAFELPKGSYATILVKRITEVADTGQ